MDQGIWRNTDFQVCVTVRKTYALANKLKLLSVYCLAVLLASCLLMYLAGKITKMDQGIWRNDDFRVCVTSTKT
jgi:uncharacterized membrane protein (DUF485 family)